MEPEYHWVVEESSLPNVHHIQVPFMFFPGVTEHATGLVLDQLFLTRVDTLSMNTYNPHSKPCLG